MGNDNNSDGKNKNPWGNAGGSNNGGGGRGNDPWGNYPGGGDNPNIDEMLRRAQKNFRQAMPGGDFRGGKFIGLAILAIILLWLASGFYIIEPGYQGVIQRFGAWNRTQVQEGLGYHLPYPVETITKLNVSEVRRMEIGFNEFYSRGSTQKRDIPEESLMLTSDANIVDLDLVVLWTIKSAEDYLFNIRTQENTIKKVAESAIREVVGQTPMFQIITTGRADVSQAAKEIMIKNLDDYQSGVDIGQVLIQKAEVHPDVQNAFQDVQSAKQDAIDTQNVAQAYREEIIPKARGAAIQMVQEAKAYRESKIAQAEGDADRFNSVYKAYLTGKDVTKTRMYLETMESVLGNAEKIILDNQGGAGGAGVVPYLPIEQMGAKQKRAQ